MASPEIDSFRRRFAYEFDRLLRTLEGLDEEAVNWRPEAPSANSILVLVTHAIASAEDHVVRRANRKPVVRSRDAEFAATGEASRLSARADEVKQRIYEALAEIDGRLGEEREPPDDTWPGRWTVSDTLLNSVAHPAEHAGHAELTRDLCVAKRGST
ncbi:MAG: DinB family protein [Chloroflexota bacterium]|nr:DinB family protein [Chloroflexota bacterium]